MELVKTDGTLDAPFARHNWLLVFICVFPWTVLIKAGENIYSTLCVTAWALFVSWGSYASLQSVQTSSIVPTIL